jgi:hypothetical protein
VVGSEKTGMCQKCKTIVKPDQIVTFLFFDFSKFATFWKTLSLLKSKSSWSLH